MRQGSVERVRPDLTPPLREEWQDDALCVETDPEIFFPDKGGTSTPAKRVCLACDVREQCLAYALEHRINEGVFGATTGRTRLRILAGERVWTPQEDETLRDMNAQGFSDVRVAQELGWSYERVRTKRIALGLPAHRGGRPRKEVAS